MSRNCNNNCNIFFAKIGILGCGISFLPLKYLGLPLGASYKAKFIWNSAIKKIEHW